MPALKSAKHEAFCRAIVEGKPGRAAYAAAGYSAKPSAADTNASRLLKNAQVSARIAELKAEAAKASGVTAQMVIDELAKIAFANLADYVHIGADGEPAINLGKMSRFQAAAVQSVKVADYKDGRGEDARDVREVTFKLWDKRAALVDLGNYLGIFKPQRIEHTGPNGGPIESKDVGEYSPLEVARRIAFALELGRRELEKTKTIEAAPAAAATKPAA